MKKLFTVLLLSLAVSTTLFAKNISAYLTGPFIDVASAKEKLAGAGFDLVVAYESVEDGTTLVFTNDALKAEASKPKRAQMAVLRMFIDNKNKMVSFTNPVYFGKAFMQDDYQADVFEKQLSSIKKAFPNLKASSDMLDEDDISDYHFMMGMPYYEDGLELGEDKNNVLLKKAEDYKNGKDLLFTLKLANGNYLLGYDLPKTTKKFVEKIGRVNAAVLPYLIMIEDKEAKILHPKYYLAISYPLLNMGGFMGISSIPGEIEDALEKPFK